MASFTQFVLLGTALIYPLEGTNAYFNALPIAITSATVTTQLTIEIPTQ